MSVLFFSLEEGDSTPFHIVAEMTMKTNFFGIRDLCTELLPLIRPQGESGGDLSQEMPASISSPASSLSLQLPLHQPPCYVSTLLERLCCFVLTSH